MLFFTDKVVLDWFPAPRGGGEEATGVHCMPVCVLGITNRRLRYTRLNLFKG